MMSINISETAMSFCHCLGEIITNWLHNLLFDQCLKYSLKDLNHSNSFYRVVTNTISLTLMWVSLQMTLQPSQPISSLDVNCILQKLRKKTVSLSLTDTLSFLISRHLGNRFMIHTARSSIWFSVMKEFIGVLFITWSQWTLSKNTLWCPRLT